MTAKQFKQTIVMITHNEYIAQLADRVIHIEDGKITREAGR
jgi:putative ABC transport system ATP-binding protein